MAAQRDEWQLCRRGFPPNGLSANGPSPAILRRHSSTRVNVDSCRKPMFNDPAGNDRKVPESVIRLTEGNPGTDQLAGQGSSTAIYGRPLCCRNVRCEMTKAW